ncbi:MAG: MBL fold metallo-hydrolase [Clostridia bacterium]|nr:MBL fold metallo-hydrolase [Clostridia bacterium]
MIMKVLETGMFHTNCYLVGDTKTNECILFDPGASITKLMGFIEESGMKVRYIVLTHAHFDHVMAAPAIQDATGAELLIHEKDAPLLSPDNPEANRKGYLREVIRKGEVRDTEYKMPRVDRLLHDGDTIELGDLCFKVLNTPGHTAGSCTFICGDVMISGDTLFKDACGRWDMTSGSEDDMMVSLRRLHDLEGNYRVFSGHGIPTTLDAERQYNIYMRRAVAQPH